MEWQIVQAQDIDSVFERIPLLTEQGIGLPYAYGVPQFEIWERRDAEKRAILGHGAALDKVCAWLGSDVSAKTKGFNRISTSYGLRNIAEELLGIDLPVGAFIAAAVHQGFGWRQVNHNAIFNICPRFVERAVAEIDHARAVSHVEALRSAEA